MFAWKKSWADRQVAQGYHQVEKQDAVNRDSLDVVKLHDKLWNKFGHELSALVVGRWLACGECKNFKESICRPQRLKTDRYARACRSFGLDHGCFWRDEDTRLWVVAIPHAT